MTPAESRSALVCFLENTHKAFSHDLRSPIGTIVNYATVLEGTEGPQTEVVRDLSRRIRGNAQRIARMIQTLVSATSLASRSLRSTTTDLAAFARSILADAGGRGQVRMTTSSREPVIGIDSEILGFAWRAFVAVQADARGAPVHAAELEVVRGGEQLQLEFRCAPDLEQLPPQLGADVVPAAELQSFLRLNNGPGRLECGFGLSLAEHLIVCHGGTFSVWGRPGSSAGLRLSMAA
jgi:K+-sensing histidine kinase KdpD